MDTYDQHLEAWFPNLTRGKYKVTSPVDRKYNCVAWAAKNNTKFWWPDRMLMGYWPEDIPREETLEAFIKLYESVGYELCKDESLEKSFEKIAIFVNQSGIPTHAARQLPSGRWTSKLGEHKDIEHNLQDLTGVAYGKVGVILKKSN